jgi:hypothetical protein
MPSFFHEEKNQALRVYTDGTGGTRAPWLALPADEV